MKVIIDANKKTIEVIGSANIFDLAKFVEDHGFADFVISDDTINAAEVPSIHPTSWFDLPDRLDKNEVKRRFVP